MNIFELITKAAGMRKFALLAKNDITLTVVRVNIVEDNDKFIAILSGGLLDQTVIGVDVTNTMDGFNDAIRSTGYVWCDIMSGLTPYVLPLVALRHEQNAVNDNEEYRNRLLLVRA